MAPLPRQHRYALYFAPPATHPLWRAGCALLGRDPESGAALAQPVLPGIAPERFAALTAEANRYGWHGTLKPPFALAEGTDAQGLDAAIAGFAAARRGFAMPPLTLAMLSGFLAVVPAQPSPMLDALAAECVRDFDAFRAAPSEAELAKRRRSGLAAEEEENLRRWGYPYVMGRFRFHMTLTARLADDEAEALMRAMRPLLAEALAASLSADGIALYGEAEPGAPFRLLRRYGFGA